MKRHREREKKVKKEKEKETTVAEEDIEDAIIIKDTKTLTIERIKNKKWKRKKQSIILWMP